jgi:hypothetical protein
MACAPTAVAVLVKVIEIAPLQVNPWVAPDAWDVCRQYGRGWMGGNDTDLGAGTEIAAG